MAGALRSPFLFIAWFALLIALGIETGANWLARTAPVTSFAASSIADLQNELPPAYRPKTSEIESQISAVHNASGKPPGYAIPDMALFDGLLLFTATLTALSRLAPHRIHGRLQGIATLIFAVLIGLLTIKRIFTALAALITMITLLFATPFGTIAYFALFGFFDVGGASQVLSVVFSLKLAFVILLLLAQQSFLQIKSLVVLIVFSILLSLLTAFLLHVVPGPFVSITDALGGLINAVVALIWIIIYFIFGLIATIRAIRFGKALQRSKG